MLPRLMAVLLFFWIVPGWTGTFDDDEFDVPVLKEEPTAEYRRTYQGINLFRSKKGRETRWWVQNTTDYWICVWTKVIDTGGAPYIVFLSVSVPPDGGERLLGIVKRGFWPVDYEFNWYVQPLRKPSDFKINRHCSSELIAYDSRIPEITLSLLETPQATRDGNSDRYRRGH